MYDLMSYSCLILFYSFSSFRTQFVLGDLVIILFMIVYFLPGFNHYLLTVIGTFITTVIGNEIWYFVIVDACIVLLQNAEISTL